MNEITNQEYQTAKAIVEEYEANERDKLESDAINKCGGCSNCGDLCGFSCVCDDDDDDFNCEMCQDNRALCFCENHL